MANVSSPHPTHVIPGFRRGRCSLFFALFWYKKKMDNGEISLREPAVEKQAIQEGKCWECNAILVGALWCMSNTKYLHIFP